MDLRGKWRCAKLNDDLLASAPDPDLDDSHWAEVNVPGHWAQDSELQNEEGSVVYRRHFTIDNPKPDERSWLRFDGIVGDAEVWLDGVYLGECSEYFKQSRFDASKLLHPDEEQQNTELPLLSNHLLAVEVAASAPSDSKKKRSLTGALRSSHLSASGSPTGIWKDIAIDRTGPVAILHSRLLCTEANEKTAKLNFRLVLDSATSGKIRIDTSVVGPEGQTAGGASQDFSVASGENQIEWSTSIEEPRLWWPAELGDQPLYDVALAIRFAHPEQGESSPDEDNPTDDADFSSAAVSDRQRWRTGLRTVEVNKFIWRVNGKRLFVRGISLGPSDPKFPELAKPNMTQDVRAAAEAGLNLIRVHGHISHTELYEQADSQGILIWQDLPLVGEYAVSTRKPAQSLARSAVDVLGHHPSISVWCAHDEPNGPPLPEPQSSLDPLGQLGKHLGRHVLPSWNRSVLGPLVRRQLRQSDPSRSVITRSGSLPGLTELDRSDPHLWLGWHSGNAGDLTAVFRKWPRLASFLGGFGTQSVTVQDWGPNEPLWDSAQRGAFERYMPRRSYANGFAWASASRYYQADTIRQQIETVRRLKYRPSGGFCVTALVDAEPEGGFGILDYNREPKPAYEAVIDAARPVVITADRPPSIAVPGQTIALQVHATSDLRIPLEDITVRAEVSVGNFKHAQSWTGSLEADTCAFIGTVKFVVPSFHGPLTLDLELQGSSQVATNRYTSAVIPSSEAKVRRRTTPGF